MDNKEKQQLSEEFREKFLGDIQAKNKLERTVAYTQIEDFWLNKISQRDKELVEKIEFFERDMRIRLHDEPFEIVKSGLEDIKTLIK